MSQLIGTGKDPRYPDGVAFDVPPTQGKLIEELLDAGLAKVPTGPDDWRKVEIANGVVRGDFLSLPEDRKIAKEIEGEKGPTAHDIVHTDDPGAKPGASDLSVEEAEEAVAQKQATQIAVTAPDAHISGRQAKAASEHVPTPRDPAKDAAPKS